MVGSAPETPVSTAPHITVLQLSDLQFGRHHRFVGEPGLGSLLDRVTLDLEKLRDTCGFRPDLVLLTGDLSEWGMATELEQARLFAAGLGDRLGLPARRVVLLPGNHDINRKLCEGYFATSEGRAAAPSPPYFPKYEPFAAMFARFYAGCDGLTFTEKEPWTFFEYPELRVVVAALNSTIADSHLPDDHYGFVGEAQIRWFIERLRPYRERGFLRIGAVHHDILSPEHAAARQDRTDIENKLAPYLNMLVHGHTHVEQMQWIDGKAPVPVLGIGSAGVKAAERPEEVPNQYQIVQIYADRIRYGRRAYVVDKKDWVGCLRSNPDGESWETERAVRFDRAEATFSAPVVVSSAGGTDSALLLEEYRRAWARIESMTPLFDIAARGEDEEVARDLDFLRVFVPPKARRASPAALDTRDPDEGRGPRNPRRGRDRKEPRDMSPSWSAPWTTPPERVEDLAVSPDEPWLVILGAPGAGKTALTRWVGLKLCVAGESFGEALRDMVPVRIDLRQFAERQRATRDAGRAYDFLEYLDDTHRERSIDLRGGDLRALAAEGRILWLFDGLDEVPDVNRRREIAVMIAGVRLKYGGRGG